MKYQVLVITFFLFGISSTPLAQAQVNRTLELENAIKIDGKYALLVQHAKHFMVSVMTGEEYKAKSKHIQFEIVLIGDVVKDLAENAELMPFVKRAEQAGVNIVVCEFAMGKLGVKKLQYHPSIQTTPNGFTYLFGLQELGFKSIVL